MGTASNGRQVAIVDDDEVGRMYFQRLCDTLGIPIESFSSPTSFLECAPTIGPACVLIDRLMPEIDGLDLFERIKEARWPFTCILITNYADTASCRAAFHAGMFDFIEKSASHDEFSDVIKRAIAHNNQKLLDATGAPGPGEGDEQFWLTLSEREREVAGHLIEGSTLKKISSILGISVQTVSKHRIRIFEKLDVENEVELLKWTMARRAQ